MPIEFEERRINPDSLTTGKNLPVKQIIARILGDSSIATAEIPDDFVSSLLHHGYRNPTFTLAEKNGVSGSGKKTTEDLFAFMKSNGINPDTAAEMIKSIGIGDRFSLVNGLIGTHLVISGFVRRGLDDNDHNKRHEIILAVNTVLY